MKLRKLTLQGYKTFASKTEFVFDSGITAIVGPNGSGKSNIADALRWVLGEQSYSTLRARRSADMIFAGGPQRARAGMAQAIITLDNSDGWLPIDYSEVEIARRSFRSGENEYLINGQQVRLKDVADLLATSGLAERTYTIIGQGLVDQALSLRSDERRALFEEAAGITHYKTRRAETLRRLEETQRNLQRVLDILEELRPRVASLRRQATRTRNYEQISTDLRALLRVWYGYKWEQTKRELRGARQTAGVTEAAWEEARRRLLAIQEAIDLNQRRITEIQGVISGQQAKRDQLREAFEVARREQAVYRERHASLARQIEEATGELELLAHQQVNAQSELNAAVAQLSAAQDEMRAQQERLDQFHTSFQTQQQAIDRANTDIARLEAERRRSQTALAQAQGQLIQLRERLAELTAKRPDDDPGSKEKADLEASRRQIEARLAMDREQLAKLQDDRQRLIQARRNDINQLKSLRQVAQDGARELGTLRKETVRLEERVAILDRSRERAISLNSSDLVGQLARLIQLPPVYETALAAALGDRLATWVVKSDNALWQAIEAARTKQDDQESRLLLMVLADSTSVTPDRAESAGRPTVTGESGIIGWANELAGRNDALTPLIDRLLGSVLLVEDAPTAYRLASRWPAGFQAVTRDGLVVHGGGLVEVQPAGSGQSILAREARWREALNRLEEKQHALAEAEQINVARQQAIDALQETVDEQANEAQQLEKAENEIRQRLANDQRAIDRIIQQLEYSDRREAERAKSREQLKTRIAETEAAIDDLTSRLEATEQQLATSHKTLAALPVGEAEAQRSTLRQALNTAQTILAGRQAVVDSRRATLNQIDSQLNRLQQRLSSLEEQFAGLRLEGDASTTTTLEHELAELEAGLQPLTAGMAAERTNLANNQHELTALQKSAHELETQFTQSRIRLTQYENQAEGLQERIRNDLGLVSLSYDAEQTGATPLPIREVVEQLPVVDTLPVDIEENIHLYRGQLQRMGPINPDAPAELSATEERFEFLTRQVEDLTQTDAQLRTVIAELDELTSKAFAKTVEEVNSLFDHTFKQLFGGGSGRLVMTDPDDPTSSGVEIIARLPNRREQGLALLSGGERSLTAAALIFSLLKVAPPPFCVLDEVDAALDEANVTRFRDLLSELSRDTQFILITHNRGTVQAAQTLYGVSMQPDSSSQVISIRPEEFLRA